MKIKLFTLLFFLTATIAHSQPGSITEIQVLQRPDGSGLVDVTYDIGGCYVLNIYWFKYYYRNYH